MSDSPYNRTISCEPTLLDQDVIDFCRNGYLMLPSVVSDDINRRVLDYLDNADSTHEPTPIMKEDWFVDGVILNPQAAGAVRSLLGNNFTLPAIISNHRGPLPFSGQNWHRDGGSIYTHLSICTHIWEIIRGAAYISFPYICIENTTECNRTRHVPKH